MTTTCESLACFGDPSQLGRGGKNVFDYAMNMIRGKRTAIDADDDDYGMSNDLVPTGQSVLVGVSPPTEFVLDGLQPDQKPSKIHDGSTMSTTKQKKEMGTKASQKDQQPEQEQEQPEISTSPLKIAGVTSPFTTLCVGQGLDDQSTTVDERDALASTDNGTRTANEQAARTSTDDIEVKGEGTNTHVNSQDHSRVIKLIMEYLGSLEDIQRGLEEKERQQQQQEQSDDDDDEDDDISGSELNRSNIIDRKVEFFEQELAGRMRAPARLGDPPGLLIKKKVRKRSSRGSQRDIPPSDPSAVTSASSAEVSAATAAAVIPSSILLHPPSKSSSKKDISYSTRDPREKSERTPAPLRTRGPSDSAEEEAKQRHDRLSRTHRLRDTKRSIENMYFTNSYGSKEFDDEINNNVKDNTTTKHDEDYDVHHVDDVYVINVEDNEIDDDARDDVQFLGEVYRPSENFIIVL